MTEVVSIPPLCIGAVFLCHIVMGEGQMVCHDSCRSIAKNGMISVSFRVFLPMFVEYACGLPYFWRRFFIGVFERAGLFFYFIGTIWFVFSRVLQDGFAMFGETIVDSMRIFSEIDSWFCWLEKTLLYSHECV